MLLSLLMKGCGDGSCAAIWRVWLLRGRRDEWSAGMIVERRCACSIGFCQ